MEEVYKGYRLKACPLKTRQGRWSVSVEIQAPGGNSKGESFTAHDGISYILEEEAAKECLNLGKRLIDLNRV